MLITCPKCNKYLSADAVTCPACGHKVKAPSPAPEKKEEKKNVITEKEYSIDAERVLLYGFMSPALENFNQCRPCVDKITSHLREFRDVLSPKAVQMLCEYITSVSNEAIKEKKEMEEYNASKVLEAFSNYTKATSSSTYKGLGFSVITDTAGAVAYSALNAFEGIKHDLMQEKSACKRFLNEISSISSSDSSWALRNVFQAIDEIAAVIPELFEAKKFVEAHNYFYHNPKYDLGVTAYGEKSVYNILWYCMLTNDFVDRMFFTREMPATAYQKICDLGYIRVFGDYYFTTGLYERQTLEALEEVENPAAFAQRKKKIAEHNRICIEAAEKAVKAGNVWSAAVSYGKTINDPKSIEKSLLLWKKLHKHGVKISYNILFSYKSPIVTDVCGTPYNIYGSGGNAYIPSIRTKDRPHIENVHSVIPFPDIENIYVQFDGEVSCIYPKSKYSNKLSLFSDVTSYVFCNNIDSKRKKLFAVTSNGKAIAIGEERLVGWEKIEKRNDIKLLANYYGDSVIALTKDGDFVAAGEVAECMQPPKKLHPNAVHISLSYYSYTSKYCVYGIDEDGSVWVEGTGADATEVKHEDLPKNVLGAFGTCYYLKNGKIAAPFGEKYRTNYLKPLEKIVKIEKVISKVKSMGAKPRNQIFALLADGTVIGPELYPEIKEWKDVVDIFIETHSDETIYYAINSKGEILSTKHGKINLEKPLFNSADTIFDEKRQALYDLLAKKKDELSKANGIFAGKARNSLKNGIACITERIKELEE